MLPPGAVVAGSIVGAEVAVGGRVAVEVGAPVGGGEGETLPAPAASSNPPSKSQRRVRIRFMEASFGKRVALQTSKGFECPVVMRQVS